jgi:hypothetical protein
MPLDRASAGPAKQPDAANTSLGGAHAAAVERRNPIEPSLRREKKTAGENRPLEKGGL